jgi:hypothetical protein
VRYVRNPEVLWRSTSLGPVVLAPDRAEPERLGGLAAIVWELLDGPRSAEDLATDATALIPDRPDVAPCLDALVAAGLVVPASIR